MNMMRKIAVWLLIVALLEPAVIHAQVAAVSAATAAPAASAVIEPAVSTVSLVAGRSTVLEIGAPIARVSLTSADVADALVTSPSQLLIHGKTPGTISMFVWERDGAVRRYDVAVARDVARLEEQVTRLFPGEAIQVSSNGRDVVLSGHVTSQKIVEQAVNLSAGFVERPEDVVSLLQVQAPPSRQVLLRVRFAEVSRSALTELGVSLFTGPTGIENTLGRVTTQQFGGPGYSDLSWTKDSNDFGAAVQEAEGKVTFSDFLNLFILSERFDLGVLIRALQTRGLFQSLAEPNLVAESGKEASFLAGGEFPIPVAQAGGGNAITVEFKEFGVRLNFLPTVNGDRVHLRVRPEVSTLDFANGIQLQGFRIPALVSRRTETELELRDGQTFAIAGLMNNSMTSTMQKIPGIGDIPILGYLFRSKAAQKNRTELVVMITPHILPEGSPGVTSDLPRLNEPYLSPLGDNESFANPPPAFPQPGTVSAPAALATGPAPPALAPAAAVAPGPRPGVAAAVAPIEAPAPVPAAAPPLTPAERRAMERTAERELKEAAEREERERKEAAERAERERKEAAEREKAEAREQKAAAEAERRRLKEEEERQKTLARDQARRDEEEARRAADAEKRAAEQARREAEAEEKRQASLDAAAAKLRAAEAAYLAELARSGGSR
jgi:pilus assembly protein CpaC